ncbi:hypothetical protein MUK42_25235 [Musa troglodytarum]|uniref:Uncharacterized protein n=1 Tax=Musa troglodytarum TaxID=320322 RepID=A0A9E7HXK9_9LILI|nr:hypothetical protein MUK42_25235 [Musa troglodytarum]
MSPLDVVPAQARNGESYITKTTGRRRRKEISGSRLISRVLCDATHLFSNGEWLIGFIVLELIPSHLLGAG